VPVVGTSMTGDHWNDNPMLFPPMGAGDSSSWATARMMKLAGVTKVGIISCAEAQDCKTGQSRVARAAEAEGLQVVYQGQYSVTQPDFTAECIQMHRSGAEAIYPPGDTASGIRMAKSCARQAYRPIWVTPTPATSLASIPEYEGGIGISPVFPWFLRSGSPAIVEYAQALQQYAPKQAADGVGFLSWSWVSAKLIEKAAQHVSDKPTSQDILNGLWSMRGETLGGLLPGRAARTFIRNQPTPETFCTYRARIQGGRWVAPDGLNPTCR
jgi:branched-chain amino acid transport system substrate-binding protein